MRTIPCLLLVLIVTCIMNTTASANKTNTFTVAHTWNGVALAKSDEAVFELTWLPNGDLNIVVDAPFANDPRPNCEKAACWELWNFEVVEIFLVGSGDPVPYTEIEISPWGNHLVLQLLGARNTIAKELPLNLKVARGTKRWSADAILSASLLPRGDLTVNAYRIHGSEPNRHYHAMTPLSGDKPDFHRITQFMRIFKGHKN